jgi:hypothetical protein
MRGNGTVLLSAETTGRIYLPNQKLIVEGNADLILKGPTDRIIARAIQTGGIAQVSVSADALAISMQTYATRLQ